MYDCQETLKEMHALPLDKTLQIAALGRAEVAKVILGEIHHVSHILLLECFISQFMISYTIAIKKMHILLVKIIIYQSRERYKFLKLFQY